ncbi:unnamed protein product [Calypogeia fissa]
MSSSALELSILKLTSPRKRLGQSGRFSFDNDPAQQHGTSNSSFSPRGKATGGNSAAAPWFADDDLFTIFEQQQPRAAVPFKWEAIPGTRRDQRSSKDADASKVLKKELSYTESLSSKDGMWDSEEQDNSSTSSPTFSLSPSGSTNSTTSSSSRSSLSLPDESQLVVVHANPTKFQIDPIQIPSTTFTEDDGSDDGNADGFDRNSVNDSRKFVEEPVISRSGNLMPLKPPPGMHSIKQLLSLETEDRSITMSCFSSRSVNNLISSSAASNSITNLKSHQRRSFRRDGLKALPFVSSTPKNQSEDFLNNMLGMEEWSKVVKKQEKEEKHQQQEETAEIRGSHHRTLSMPRLAFPFKKKSTTEADCGSSDILDADTIFNDDFGKKGGLRERRPLSSVSSRSFSDVHKPSRAKNWVFDNNTDYSDDETTERDEFFDSQMIAEEDEKEKHVESFAKNDDVSISITQVQAKEQRKSDALSRLRRIFNLSHRSSNGEQYRISHHKPARLSSVSPAPLPPLAPTQTELRLKKVSQQKQVSKNVPSSPILKMCSALPFGNALLKNVKQLRSFEFHTSRALTSK